MDPAVKLKRAEKRLKELREWVKKYFDITPYRVAVRINNSTRRPEYYIAGVDNIPVEITLLAGEVVQNLRSTLDHIMYKAFRKNSLETANASHVYFPISQNYREYKKSKQRKTKGVAQNVIDYIDSQRPYKEGNVNLWRINKLNNIDKHRLLVTVGSSYASVDIAPTIIETMQKVLPEKMGDITKLLPNFFIRPADNLLPLKVGDVLFVDLPDKQLRSDLQFQFFIAFNEEGVVEGEELIGVLETMYYEVEKVLNEMKQLI